MTSQGNGQPVRYDVSMSQRTRTVLKELHARAAQAGRGSEFLATFRQVVERLRTDPLNFDEPQYRLPALQLLMCQGIVSGLVVDFAVHEHLPLVFIREVRSLS
jgi:hypothetical protein